MILQNILYPSEETCPSPEMYYHQKGSERIFNGYFNLFSAGKWRAYTQIDSLFLSVSGKGRGKIILCSEEGRLSETEILEGEAAGTLLSFQKTVRIPYDDNHSFYWFSFLPLEKGAEVDAAYYFTERQPDHKVRLAIAVCTYKREMYVRRNMDLLKSRILDNPSALLYNNLDIFLVDNGRTLDPASFTDKHMYLFQNMNAGGSGGFTRGMIEILERQKDRGFTHVILLDDDALMEPDAFNRTYALLSYLKEKHQKSCIAGTLLDLHDRYMQNEAGALYDKGVTSAIGKGRDLRELSTVCAQEEIRRSDYAGWWYACYPLTVVRKDNLPLPYFIHYDDMEYGLRNQNGNICLNGIAVWHEKVDRQSQAVLYYGIRNRLITNALHTDITWKEEDAFLRNAILYDTLRYQYQSADLIWQAVRDFLGGPARLSRIDPEEMNQKVRSMAEKFVPYQEVAGSCNEQEEIRKYIDNALAGKIPEPKVSKKIYRITVNGWLFPARKQKRPALYSIYLTDMRDLYRKKEAILIDPYSKKVYQAEKSYSMFFHNLMVCGKIHLSLRKYYDKAAAAWRNGAGKLETEKSWRKYLHLGKEDNRV